MLAIEEAGDPDAVTDLTGRLGGEWHAVLSEHFEPAHPIRVGFLSRLPLQVVADVADFPEHVDPVQADDQDRQITKMGRGALAVRVEPTAKTEMFLVAAHLKSKLLSFPGPGGTSKFTSRDEGQRARFAAYALYRRAAEAITVRALADKLLADQGRTKAVMVMGDLNDEPQAATTQILLGPPGSEIGTPGADRPDKGDGARLLNLAPLIPEAERFSRIYHGQPELIDHIMASSAVLDHIQEVRSISPQPLPSVTDDATARRNDPASDHSLLLTTSTSRSVARRERGLKHAGQKFGSSYRRGTSE
ncbi:endonuclease [Actinomadura sp. HBU206391]|nr:endonuclease/exonuclease/phosphatase family protein [Actinomadura sp. HBU206391]MBC6463478.1 endonuclease [Actinomadura sp. HBU206391]